MTDLDSLIEELEKAEEDTQHTVIYDVLQHAREEGWLSGERYIEAMGFRRVGAYLDAALTLVPERHDWLVTKVDEKITADVGMEGTFNFVTCEGSTPALALCIAALKARRE